MLNLSFATVSSLKSWLKAKQQEASTPEAFDNWLQSFFDEGNIVFVYGEEYDYWACWELV